MPLKTLILGRILPFVVGVSVGCGIAFILCWTNWWNEVNQVQVLLQPAPSHPGLHSEEKELIPDYYEHPLDNWKEESQEQEKLPSVLGCPDRPLRLLILVLSSPTSSIKRMAIRGTWINAYKSIRSRNSSVRTLFLVGLLDLSEEKVSSLREENGFHHDMLLLEDLKDSYYNLSAKVLHGLQWSQRENVEFDYLIKTDDDSYVRIKEVSDALKQMKCPKDLYWGYFMGYAFPEPSGKWMERNWFKCPHYMPYAMGGGYILSHRVVKAATRFSERLILYSNEDTTVSSWLSPYKLVRKHDLRFNVESVSHGCNNDYLISHKERVKTLHIKYMSLLKNGTLCVQEKEIQPAYIYNWTANPLECCQRIHGLPIA